ncbi:MAG TPA: hypothetical protein VN642_02075 [Dongiaceae bacterium]|nr:hypothetical protein [Dongiaceae bacterium]
MRLKATLLIILLPLAITFSGCASIINQGASAPVSFRDEWAVLPFVNNTETPYAAERAESITAALLYSRGVRRLATYPVEAKGEALSFDRGQGRQKEALEWAARQKKIRYAVTGVVNEWRYKVGLDGEPVVGMTLQVVELASGKVLWSASGAMSGWSRDAVSAVAQQVINKLLGTIDEK